ncbi:MFS transporter [Actinoplanes sp. NPDC051346]|uniref:MFS transporter n=1 Tax=Actinoplanes sp. NPDC051346 TaxID=3155048 RepID=UPI003437BE99
MTAYAGTADPPRVRGRWIALLSVANLGLWVGYYAPLQVLLPNQVEDLAGADKTTALGVITGVGALVAVVAGPVAGAFSDATTARTGRRHTWTAVGALTGLVGLVLLSGQRTLLGLTLCWCLAQAGLNTLQAGVTAIVPDRTPVTQRGRVSGWVGLAQSVGVVLAVLLVTEVVTGLTAGYLLTGLLVVLAAAPFVLLTRDPPVTAEFAPRFTARSVLTAFRFRPGEAPDFAWAWATRFLVQLGNAMATLYLLYFLRDQVHHPDAEQGLLLLVLVYTAGTVLTVVVGGVVSDRIGRRKPSVIVSGYVMAAAAVLLALWPTWPGALIAAAVLGLGFGVYLSVDQALITQVLPAARDRARDLGVINIANSAPQVLGPALAFPIVAYLGGYPVLFLTVAAVTVLGSVLVTRIRSVA